MPFTDQDKKDIKNNARLAIQVEAGENETGLATKEDLEALKTELFESIVGDPGPLADLLYSRIADGVWEQLSKFGEEKGFAPPKAE